MIARPFTSLRLLGRDLGKGHAHAAARVVERPDGVIEQGAKAGLGVGETDGDFGEILFCSSVDGQRLVAGEFHLGDGGERPGGAEHDGETASAPIGVSLPTTFSL